VLALQWVLRHVVLPGPQNAALQIITPNQMRGQGDGTLFLFVFNVIGFGAGPTVGGAPH